MAKMSLKAARVNAGLSQKAAADEFGISNKTLSKWENGITYPTVDMLHKMCVRYGVHYDDIIILPSNPL